MTNTAASACRLIGFLGAGRMATALARGVISAGYLPPERIIAADPDPESLARFRAAVPGCGTTPSNQDLADRADLLVLAIKPQQAPKALPAIRLNRHDTTVLSVMAGIRLGDLERWLHTRRLIRCMPNTPSLIGRGAIGLAADPAVPAERLAAVEQLLQSIGYVVRTPETQLDAVTGLSGSGPAFVFSFFRGMMAGGSAAGLPLETARMLTWHTLSGALEMLRDPSVSPDELIAQVTSPGGTTIRGLETLQAGGFENLIAECILAASCRARELGQLNS